MGTYTYILYIWFKDLNKFSRNLALKMTEHFTSFTMVDSLPSNENSQPFELGHGIISPVEALKSLYILHSLYISFPLIVSRGRL